MRILLTNNTLGARAGSELYVYDVALELLRRGHHPIAYSTVHGEVAGQLRAATVPVIDSLADCGEPPDLIHGHHHYETLTASLHFPDAPVVNFCHGWTPVEEEPLVFPRVLRYVAVDDTCRDRLVDTFGIEPGRVTVLLNSVDTGRFRRRPALPDKPRRALAFGNYFTRSAQLAAIEGACGEAGIELDVIGLGSNHAISDPENILPAYDLVFAKARAALEAMAVGSAVVLAGPRGFGPMVTSRNWSHVRRVNCGVRALTLPVCTEVVVEQIGLYDAADAGAVCALVRSQACLANAVDQLVQLYEEVIAEFRTVKAGAGEAERAAARHLNRYAATFKAYSLEYGIRAHDIREQRTRDAFRALLNRVEIANAAPGGDAAGGDAAGNIESAVRRYGVMRVTGWAAQRGLKQPCTAVLFLQNDQCAGVAFLEIRRPDVGEHLGTHEVSFGFDAQFDADDGPVRVVALMSSGEAFDISAFAEPEAGQVLKGIGNREARGNGVA